MKYLLILLLWFCGTLAFAQAPDIYKLVYDSMELVTGGVSSTKTISIKKDQDYKVILLEVPTGHNGYDVVISFKPKVVVDPTPVYLDNLANFTVNNQLVNTYIPASAWTLGNVQGHFGNTIQFSNVANSTLVTKFTGTQIEWIGERDKHLGIAAVSIDNGTETLVGLYTPTNFKQQGLYNSPVLTQGLHTIKIRVTGTKASASTGTFVVHDAFKVVP